MSMCRTFFTRVLTAEAGVFEHAKDQPVSYGRGDVA